MGFELLIGRIISLVLFWGIATAFILNIRYFSKRNKPIPFWNGTTIDMKSISDISTFNKAVSKVYVIYALFFFFSGILIFFLSAVFFITIIVSTIGIIALSIIYNRMVDTYKEVGN